ncbi:hypothetical protein AAE02nite_12340 [Adhaeribacter aerolatus]|uniref:Uncharacterized protein n=1 Tax=Adhaeribacter aerolatus TaxID=670289 RepID=A0A512AV55_9BACT|nr:hypothetical protein AAE02nite_12340 [Adhaeribacter aerolatus]
MAPATAPKIGPSPAIFRNWIRNIFQAGMGTKSTPSVMVRAGVGRSGLIPNMRSITFEYRKYPTTKATTERQNEIIAKVGG